MSISVPIISEWNPKGLDRAIADFKGLEGAGAKAGFAIKKAAVPAGIALAALGGFLVNAAKGAEEARQANQKLGNVLDSMGYPEATERVSAYAESLEKSIAVDADVIKATQTKLATFGQLTKSVDVAGGAFDRATLAALDLAAAGFGSAEGNAVQLGKALEDPIKGIASLAKSGVTFTEQEKEKIQTLVESGKILDAQNMILAAVEKQVGGTAAASASSFDKMKFSLAGISDTFGELVLPHIDKFSKTLQKASDFVQKNQKLVGILVITFAGLAASVIAVNAAMKVYKAGLAVVKAAQAAWAGATKAFTAIQAAFNAVMALNPIFLIAIAIAGVIAILLILQREFGIFDGVIRVVGEAFGSIWAAIKTVFDWISENWKLILVILTGPFGLALAFVLSFKDQIIGFVSGVIDWIKNNWQLLLAILTGPFGLALLFIKTFKTQIMDVFSLIYKGIKSTMGFIADLITAPFKAAFRGIASLWNNTIGKLSFKVPGWVPGIGGKGFDVPDIPMLASGGIVDSATLALIGESGPEAVIPLDKLGNYGGGITINVSGALDPSAVARQIRQLLTQDAARLGLVNPI
jgi:hypothetical protein